jgi:hypothetical protein
MNDMDSNEFLKKYEHRIADVKDAPDLREEIRQVLLYEEKVPIDKVNDMAWRIAEELWRAK